MLKNPRLRLLLGAALISFSPVYVALVSVPATTSAFYRVAFGGAALVLWLLLRGGFRLPRPSVSLLLIAAAAMFAADLWFWHRSIIYIGPGLATLIANFQVFIMTVAGIVFFGQKPHLRQVIAIPTALGGLALIVGVDWSALAPDYRAGVIFGLLTAASYAGYLLLFRQAQAYSVSKPSDGLPTRELALVSLASAVMLGTMAGVEGESLAIPTWSDGAWLVSYAVFAHVLGWLFIASSLAHVPAALIGLSLLLQPLLSFIWDIALFDRPIVTREVFGASLALAGIWLGSRRTE
ncbi:MAG: DMT family transporter [Pseudomonadota bacterium]